MSRRKKVIVIALLAVAGVIGCGAWSALVASSNTYHVNGFSFSGHVSLEVPPAWTFRGPDAVGRKNPHFVVRSLGELGIDHVSSDERAEAVTVADHSALLLETETFAPGHGGRDHHISIYVPELKAGITVYFRTHEEDHDARLSEHFDAWRCRRWARAVISSLEWDPPE